MTGNSTTLIGRNANSSTGGISNSTALGAGAIVDADNTIQLGNTTVVAVKTSGTLTAAGLKLLTAGGVAATLSHYEEFDFTTAWPETTVSTNISLVRVGKLVTLFSKRIINISNMPEYANGVITSSAELPARFCPTGTLNQVLCPIFAYVNGTYTMVAFKLEPATDRKIRIRAMPGPFATGPQVNIERFTVSWIFD